MSRLVRRRRTREYLILSLFGLFCGLTGVIIGLMLREGRPQETAIKATPVATAAPLSDIAADRMGSVAQVEVEYRTGRRFVSTERGNGSGVLIDPRGYFMTNYHVIEDVLAIRVRLLDGQTLNVKDSAFDRTYDVAILYTGPVEGVQAIEMGSSAALRVGDPVFSVGYPRVGNDVLPGTLTAGVVSGLNRLNVTSGNISPDVGMIQIDAAINAGNSGGALFDKYGLLVGVPTMKIASGNGGESYEGLAFAIPIDVVRPIAARLIDELQAKQNGN